MVLGLYKFAQRRTLNLPARAAWITAARAGASCIEAEHIHTALRQVPAANAKITHP